MKSTKKAVIAALRANYACSSDASVRKSGGVIGALLDQVKLHGGLFALNWLTHYDYEEAAGMLAACGFQAEAQRMIDTAGDELSTLTEKRYEDATRIVAECVRRDPDWFVRTLLARSA